MLRLATTMSFARLSISLSPAAMLSADAATPRWAESCCSTSTGTCPCMTTAAPSLPIPHGDRQRLASPPLPPPPTQIDSRMLLPVGQITHSRPPLSMRRPESSLSHNPNSLGVCTRLHSQDPSDSPPIAGAQKGIGPPLHPQRRAAQRGGPPALQPCGALATPSPIAQSIMPHQI